MRSREQHLIDLIFEIGILAYDWGKDLGKYEQHHDQAQAIDRELVANWIRQTLRDGGFNVSDPIGSSWGVIRPDEPDSTTSDIIEIYSAQRPD